MKFSFFEYISCDYQRNKGNAKGLFLVFHYRLANWARYSNRLVFFLFIPYLVWYKFFIEWMMGFEVPCSTRIGKGLMIHHGQGVVVNSDVIMGEYCCLLHQVTIGTAGGGDYAKSPVIGDRVYLSVGAKVLGDVKVGDGARIGADTLVLKDIEKHAVVVGNPMRVLRYDSDHSSFKVNKIAPPEKE